jgi:hypothetical protein
MTSCSCTSKNQTEQVVLEPISYECNKFYNLRAVYGLGLHRSSMFKEKWRIIVTKLASKGISQKETQRHVESLIDHFGIDGSISLDKLDIGMVIFKSDPDDFVQIIVNTTIGRKAIAIEWAWICYCDVMARSYIAHNYENAKLFIQKLKKHRNAADNPSLTRINYAPVYDARNHKNKDL